MYYSMGHGAGLSWSLARSQCQIEGGRLAVITSNNENNQVQSLHELFDVLDNNTADYKPAWIGLSGDDNKTWVDGSTATYFAWSSELDPNDTYTAVHAELNGRWGTYEGDEQFPFICEFVSICDATPCENNGNCRPTFNGRYKCTCEEGYEGDNCQYIITTMPPPPPCESIPCEGGGLCTDDVNSYTYVCNCNETEFHGMNCEYPRLCTPDSCIHGECVELPNLYACNCSGTPYTGARCEIIGNEIEDQCSSNPCVRGECVDGIGSFFCNCSDTGYEGDICSHDINECTTLHFCQNGTCENTPGAYECTCISGYTGNRCNSTESRLARANTRQIIASSFSRSKPAVIMVGSIVASVTVFGGALLVRRQQKRAKPRAKKARPTKGSKDKKANTSGSTSGARGTQASLPSVASSTSKNKQSRQSVSRGSAAGSTNRSCSSHSKQLSNSTSEKRFLADEARTW